MFGAGTEIISRPWRASGGEGGIRTPDTVTRMPHFECGAFNRSATSPGSRGRGKSPVTREYLTKRPKGDKRVRKDARRMRRSAQRNGAVHLRSGKMDPGSAAHH